MIVTHLINKYIHDLVVVTRADVCDQLRNTPSSWPQWEYDLLVQVWARHLGGNHCQPKILLLGINWTPSCEFRVTEAVFLWVKRHVPLTAKSYVSKKGWACSERIPRWKFRLPLPGSDKFFVDVQKLAWRWSFCRIFRDTRCFLFHGKKLTDRRFWWYHLRCFIIAIIDTIWASYVGADLGPRSGFRHLNQRMGVDCLAVLGILSLLSLRLSR